MHSSYRTNRHVLLFSLLCLVTSLLLVGAALALRPDAARASALPGSRYGSVPHTTATATPTATPTATCTGWQVVYTLYISTTTNWLSGVDAVAPDDAWTVGFYDQDNGYGRTFAEHWDGAQWAVVPSANPSTMTNALNSVSMLSTDDVWAVGGQEASQGEYQPLSEHWDGQTWSAVPVTTTQGFLLSVSSVVTDDVWAVGLYNGYNTLVEHWDGAAWQTVPTPDLGGPSELESVTAVSAQDVWAVGSQHPAGASHNSTLIEHYTGTTWSLVPSPSVAGVDNLLLSVSATGPNDAWAVGYAGNNVLIEHWDGQQWTIADTPIVSDSLNGVVALSPTDVWAVGSQGTNSLILHYDGTAWTTVQNPQPRASSVFFGIAAASASDVWGVGRFGSNGRQYQMIQHYSGGVPCTTPTPTITPSPTGTPPTPTATSTVNPCALWEVVPSPTVPLTTSQLYGVDTLSPQDAWTVGSYVGSNGHEQALTERWDGQAWSYVQSPITATVYTRLKSVSAASSSDVWAVGQGSGAPYAQHWNGTAWDSVPVPSVVTGTNFTLYGVKTLAPNDSWAVGHFQTSGDQALIEHWDGSAWSVWPAPVSWEDNTFLGAVAAVSANDVWAVGANSPLATTRLDTLVLHWDGQHWSVVPSPNGQGTGNILYGVAAVSANDVWAVGLGGDLDRPLVEHWDGTQWTIIPVPASHGVLNSVTAISANNVWAVGNTDVFGNRHALALHWDGENWTSPPLVPTGIFSSLQGVAADASGAIWGVGYSVDASESVSQVIQRYRDTCVTATPTSSPTPSPTTTPSCFGPVCSTPTTTPTATLPATATPTPTVTPTAIACTINFSDVQSTDYFYIPVQYLYCHGAISGYSDGTFRPYNNTTRGQLSKIVVQAEGWPINTQGGPHFIDVPQGSAFYPYIETAYNRGVISGYSDGTFRPYNNVTRAQLCKIVVNSEGWTINTQGGPHFTDVPQSDPFYGFVETAYNRGIISGYADGTFRPGNNATRGQISKIVYNAVTQP